MNIQSIHCYYLVILNTGIFWQRKVFFKNQFGYKGFSTLYFHSNSVDFPFNLFNAIYLFLLVAISIQSPTIMFSVICFATNWFVNLKTKNNLFYIEDIFICSYIQKTIQFIKIFSKIFLGLQIVKRLLFYEKYTFFLFSS